MVAASVYAPYEFFFTFSVSYYETFMKNYLENV